jgi:hypothetical protein
MTTDETACSYGLFQIAFAALDQGITNSLVNLPPEGRVEAGREY